MKEEQGCPATAISSWPVPSGVVGGNLSGSKMTFEQSVAEQAFWKIPELAERVLLLLDPLSLLHLVQAGVLDKHVLEKSISSPVWDKLIRGGSYEEDAVQGMDVTNLVDILKLLKEPGALLLPLLDAICEKFPSVQDNWGNRNEVLIRCPNHAEPHTHRVSIHGFLLIEDVEAAFGTRKQMIESLSVDTLGEPLLSAAGSRMSRQQEQISSLSAYSRKLVWKTSRVHRPLTLFSKPRKSKSHICCSWRKHWKVLSRAMQLPSFQMSWPFAHRNAVLCVAATKHSLAKGRRKDIKAIWDALDWRIGVYKSVGEDELALYVLKSSFGTWRKLKRILDRTPEEFNAALLEFWSSHSWPPMSDTVFSDTHNISKWCNISRYFLSVKLVTNVRNFLQNLRVCWDVRRILCFWENNEM